MTDHMNDAEADLVCKAAAFAARAHAWLGQKRKYTGEPYIEHPRRVVALLREAAITSPVVLAAAWLHDVVEDTPFTLYDIHDAFGPSVAMLVAAVTVPFLEPGDTKDTHEGRIAAHLALAPKAAHSIKLADIIDNCEPLGALDPERSVRYFAKKRRIMPILSDGAPELYARAMLAVGMAHSASTEPTQ